MKSFMVMTFAMLAVAFYEMSGGAEFEPRAWRDVPEPVLAAVDTQPAETAPAEVVQAASFTPTQETPQPQVTRAALNLTDIVDDPAPAKDEIFNDAGETPVQDAQDADSAGADTAVTPEIAALLEEFPASERPEVSLPSLETAVRRTQNDAEQQTVQRDLRTVTGSVVNMRAGPGTGYDVVGQLVEGDTVEVLEDSGSGWLRLRAMGSEDTGWMAAFLLSEG